MQLFCILFVAQIGLVFNVNAGGSVPPNWWLNTLGISIKSNSQFKDLVTGKTGSDGKLIPGKIT